jgi:ribosomal protein S18 acetylase RimI-like enzyme
MTLSLPDNNKLTIRPLQYRDLETLESLVAIDNGDDINRSALTKEKEKPIGQIRVWYGLLKVLSWFPNPYQHDLRVYVAEQLQQILGFIQVSPSNRSRTTWRIDRVIADRQTPNNQLLTGKQSLGSQLLRYCLETIWEARTWVLEVNVNDKDCLSLYRENGFQPLAQITYWAIAPETLEKLAQTQPDLPNLLPVSNADAQLLYQLDCMAMHPLLRQVFDRHVQDFKTSLIKATISKFKQLYGGNEITKGYVFEPQRKAAIGYFQLDLSKDGSRPHRAELTVHPAYTWLYPQLVAQMAQIVQKLPSQYLEVASADYQPEREEYLEKLGAEQIEHTLLMSRSVWHKLREAKPLEALQLSDVFQGLKPARTPIPTRISWLESLSRSYAKTKDNRDLFVPQLKEITNNTEEKTKDNSNTSGNGHHA